MDVNQLKTYKAIILLNEILYNNRIFKTVPEGNDYLLQPVFNDMLAKGYLVADNGQYVVTDAGNTAFENFNSRYSEYLRVYDVYCAVDPKIGEFAFEKIFDFIGDTPEQDEAMKIAWNAYKNNERFYDLRIAVATFKKLDPCELVFMSFINENRFDTNNENWQVKMLADTIWAEIDNIVNTAITIEDFGGEETMKNLINKGTELMFSLINKEIELKKAELERIKVLQATPVPVSGDETVTVVTTTVEETETCIEQYEDDIVYYDPYWDPWYVSPIWLVPIFLW